MNIVRGKARNIAEVLMIRTSCRFTLSSRCLGSRSPKEEANNPHPEKFSQSAAAKWKSFDTFSLPKAQNESRPRAEPFVVAVSVGIFLLYFLWLREENDLDLELDKPLYKRIPALEQAQIKAQIRHQERQGLDSEALHLRLQQVKMEIRRQRKDE